MNIIHRAWARICRYRVVQLAVATANSYMSANCSQLAAGVALFAMLSILPLLMLMVSALQPALHPLMPNYDIRVGIQRFAQVTFSPVARRWLQEVLLSLKRNSLAVDGFSLLTFGWAAVGAFSQLDTAFHQIWRANTAPGTAFNLRVMVTSQVRQRRNATLFLLLALASFISAHFIGVEESSVQRQLPTGFSQEFLQVANPVLSWLASVFFLTLLYRWLLPTAVTWQAALLGAVVASSLNLAVKFLVTNFVDTTIGASAVNIGGPLAVVLGIYLIVQNILIGCIVVRQYMLLKSAGP
jgi:membrane protein